MTTMGWETVLVLVSGQNEKRFQNDHNLDIVWNMVGEGKVNVCAIKSSTRIGMDL